MKNNKLLIYLLSLESGAGKSAAIYANAINSIGCYTKTIFGRYSSDILNEIDNNISVDIFNVQRSLNAIPHIRRCLVSFDPDCVLVVGGGNTYAYMVAALLAGFRGKLIIREAISQKSLIESENNYFIMRLKKYLLKRAYRKAYKVIALTEVMRNEIIDYWSIPEDRVVSIPNGVSVPGLAYEKTGNPEIPVILSVGRLQPQKDHVCLLRAFALVKASRPCRLFLAGHGKERRRLEHLVSELGIENDVEFLDYVEDVSPLYREASLTVLSSRHEGFPNVLIESLAHGCPVVATDCPTGPSEIINNTKVGLLAEVSNPRDLADKILTALDTKYNPADLFSRANDFSIEKANARIARLFSDVLH